MTPAALGWTRTSFRGRPLARLDALHGSSPNAERGGRLSLAQPQIAEPVEKVFVLGIEESGAGHELGLCRFSPFDSRDFFPATEPAGPIEIARGGCPPASAHDMFR